MSNRRSIYLLVVLVTLAVSIFGLTNRDSVPKLLAGANDQPGMGASEVFLPFVTRTLIFTVNATADGADWDPGNGVCETGPGNNICTLRAAIEETNARIGHDTISVPAGHYKLTMTGAGESYSATGDLDISDHLTIMGAGPATTIIDGNQTDRVFDITGFTVLISNLTITNGKVSGDVGGGIAIGTNATVTIIRCRITNNAVTSDSSGVNGGGIYNESHQRVTIVDTVIEGNSSGYAGGGIHHAPGFSSIGEMHLHRVTVRQNTAAAFGAGIYNDWEMYLTNVTVSGNEAVGSFNKAGGGIYHKGINLEIINSTIAENEAKYGGAIYIDPFNPTGDVTLENTILADNTISLGGDPDTHNCSGDVVSHGHNLEDGDHCDFNAVGDLSNLDPLLKPLLVGSGWTPFYPLNSSSPAIDSGANAVCPAIDQRGAVRPFDGDGNGSVVCDMGSFEYP